MQQTRAENLLTQMFQFSICVHVSIGHFFQYVDLPFVTMCQFACVGSVCQYVRCVYIFLDGYCSTVQDLLDWFEVDLGFTELLFIQIDLCVMCVFVLYSPTHKSI